MKKLFLIPLMAFVVCASALAVDVSSVSELKSAVGTPNADITLTKKITWKVSDGDLNLNGATISGGGASKLAITFSGAGELTVSNGTFTGNDSYAINLPSTGSNLTLNLNKITIDNTVTYGVRMYSNILNVDENSSLTAKSRSVIVSSGASITNYGTITRLYGANTADGVTINNYGALTLNTTFSATNVSITNNSGATLTISSTLGGSYEIANAGTMSFTTGTQAGEFDITNNGTLTISGGTQSGSVKIDNKETLAITGGTHSGTFEIKNDDNMTLSGSKASKPFTGAFDITNSQTLTLTNQFFSGDLNLTNTGTLNLRGGTYNGAVAVVNNSGETHFYSNGSAAPIFGSTLSITNDATCTIDNIKATEAAVSFGGSENTTINGGSFSVEPEGAAGYILPVGNVDCYFENGVGSLSIASGYAWRSFDKKVTEASPAVRIKHANSSTETAILEQAIAEAKDGDVITLLDNVKTFSPMFFGTESVNGTPVSITLDLNGYTITSAQTVRYTFLMTHGALTVTNGVPGTGGIRNTYPAVGEKGGEVFHLHGSYLKNCNPRTDKPFTHLVIEEGVSVFADEAYGNGITISELYSSSDVVKAGYIDYVTNVYAEKASGQSGVANGVRVDVKGSISAQKYSLKVNGQVRFPDVDVYGVGTAAETYRATVAEWAGYTVAVGDTAYSPYIHIYNSARLEASANESSAVAVYSSGYGRWLIEGTCLGATGVYVKSGDVVLNDATVQSTYTGEALITTGKASGVDAYGSAVVIETNNSYSGEQSLSVNGDTQISTEAEGGSALLDVVDGAADESAVEAITINGGTFSGDNAIVISEKTAEDDETEITVNGVSLIGQTQVGEETGEAAVNSIIDPSSVHTTQIENPDGTTTVVVSTGSAPSGTTLWSDIAALAPGSNAKWEGNGDVNGVGTITGTITLGELQILSATETLKQELTIKENAALIINHLIMNDYAKIIVEAGGKLIIKGTQGIIAPSVDNIVLKTSAENPAIFLFNPAVSSNRHPNATVEFLSKSFTDGGNYAKQRFGIPTNGELTSITTKYNNVDVQTALSKFDYEGNKWVDFGWINVGGKEANLDQMKNPFDYYQMQHNTPNMGTIVTMKGRLVGNDNPVLNVREKFWNGFANSYMGPINGEQLMNMIPETVDKAIYLYDVNANQATWEPVTLIDMEDTEILPMQPFLIRNTKAAANVTINYGNAVYYPTIGESPSPAPARSSVLNDMTKVKLVVKGEDCIDRVIVAEGDQFSDDFDNGYDAAKYMNEGINMYVTSSEKMSIFATDNLENTYVGLQTIKGGAYSIEFSKVQGEDLTLIDLETGANVAMTEGNVYTFTADANSINDYRFQIVRAKKVATDVEPVEAQKNANGIYTIMGQYVGEMNLWNSLPAGVYVVNGKKLVK